MTLSLFFPFVFSVELFVFLISLAPGDVRNAGRPAQQWDVELVVSTRPAAIRQGSKTHLSQRGLCAAQKLGDMFPRFSP
jgi:hypothetical protein